MAEGTEVGIEEVVPPPPTGLLDQAAMTAEEKEEPKPEETVVDHRAEESEPIPEGVPEKFVKDGTVDIPALSKSYTELEGKLRAGLHKAPENGYDLSVAKEAGVPEDDAVLQTYAEWAKDAGISQEHFNQLASKILENGAQVTEENTYNHQAEMDSLGKNAQAIIDDQVEWAQKLVKVGTWGEDDFAEFQVWGGTANGIRALQKLRRFMGDTSKIPVNINPSADALPSAEECYEMVKDPEYRKNPARRQQVEEIFKRKFGTTPDQNIIM